MHLYLRYFDSETLVDDVEQALDFLKSIDEIGMNPVLEREVRDYVASDVFYPKRYKIRPRVYFIIIKTEAQSMADFKAKKAIRNPSPDDQQGERQSPAEILNMLNEERPGWYEGVMDFKRVVMVPGSGKFQYRDTRFVARVKAYSGMDCYQRILEHLRDRVDERSQFPSPKGRNFQFTYLGRAKEVQQ